MFNRFLQRGARSATGRATFSSARHPTTVHTTATRTISFTSLNLKKLNPRDIPQPELLAPFSPMKLARSFKDLKKLASPFQLSPITYRDTGGRGPLTRMVRPSKWSPDCVGAALSVKGLEIDMGILANTVYPWYLLRSVLPKRSIVANTHPIMGMYRTFSPNGVFGTKTIALIYALFALTLWNDVLMYQRLSAQGPDSVLPQAILIPSIDIVHSNFLSKGGLMEQRPWLTKLALKGILVQAQGFADKASSTDHKTIQQAIESFVQHQHQTISSLLYSFYRTPVTESVRAQLCDQVLPRISGGTKKSIETNSPQGVLRNPGSFSLPELLTNQITAPTQLQHAVKHAITHNLDDNTYRENLFLEMMVLGNLRRGFESLLQHNNNLTLAANPTLMSSAVANFRFIQPHSYTPLTNISDLPDNERLLIANIANICQQSPLAHLTNIVSPDVQAALGLSVRYPTMFLPYASLMLNIKSVLQDSLPPQGQTPAFSKDPSPNATLATQQLIPNDLLSLYPVIPNDHKSLALSQALLLTDLAMGQLLAEYYRVTPYLTPQPPQGPPVNSSAMAPQDMGMVSSGFRR